MIKSMTERFEKLTPLNQRRLVFGFCVVFWVVVGVTAFIII